MNKNGTKLYKPGQLNGYTYCIRQIFEENTLGYTHGSGNVTKLNNKCHNFSSEDQNGHLTGPTHPARLYAHPSEAPSSGRKEHRRLRKEKAALALPSEGKLKFADRLRALLKRESHLSGQLPGGLPQDPYAFSEAPAAPPAGGAVSKASPVAAAPPPPEPHRALENGAAGSEFFPNHRPHPQLQAQLQQPQQHVQQHVQQQVHLHVQQHGQQSASVKTFGSIEGKPKTAPVAAINSGASVSGGGVASAPKLSKTMNRLQAKIAQNKLLDKLKKAQQDSCCSSSHNHQQQQRATAASSSFVRDVGLCAVKQEVSAVRVAASRERVPRPRVKGSSTSATVLAATPVVAAPPLALGPSAALRNLRQVWALEKAGLEAEDGAAAGGPHGALDLDSSDSEPSDDDENVWQRPPSFWNCDLDCSDASTVKSVRYLRIHRLRTELRKRYELLCKRQAAARPALERQEVLVHHLAQAARLSPRRAAQVLLEGPPSSSRQAQPRGGKAASLDKPTCCYQHEGGVCAQPALPYTRHCTKHIMYNVDQLLFEHCTAKFADNTQCCVPVFDMCHELPLCPEHAKKRDNYNKMASEPKPKKPRKKSKPPALTRPPKRGKKKSKQRTPGYSPCLGPSLCLQQPSSPASSSSSCSCSSRSPPFLGSCEAAPIPSSVADVEPLLLSDLLPQPHERLHVQQHERLHVQQSQPKPQLHLVQQPHLQLQPRAAGLGLVVRVKTKPKPVATAAAMTTTTTTLTTQVHVAPHSLTPHLPVAAPLVVASTPAAAAVATAATSLSGTSLGASPGVENYGYVAPTSAGMNPEVVVKELVERIEPDLTSDLENQFSPDTIEKSLELPLDAAELANQATKLLEEHDFTEVLNKISDDAFSDFFAESKNGEYVPSKEETEELERALAAVSKDVHLARESLAKLSGSSSAEVPDLPDLVDAFPDLPLSSSDLTSLTQALMGSTPDALRTVALLSSDLHPHHPEGFAPLEPPSSAGAAVFVPASAGTAEVAASWLLGTVGQDFGIGSANGAAGAPAGANASQVGLPKQSVLAQESVS
uniref:KANL2-like probable zinc-finger domain-containing protein n=2 Tax=Ixodes ricinus TaxID=34613 RepID=A0A147BQJ9_IXORI